MQMENFGIILSLNHDKEQKRRNRNEILTLIKAITCKFAKIDRNNPNIELFKVNVYAKFYQSP